MKQQLLFLFMILFSLPSLADIGINEIMYNPVDSEEWVEFYYISDIDCEINISGLAIEDNHQADDIVCCNDNCSYTVYNGTYFVIMENGSGLNLTGKSHFCVDDSLIGNGLGNSGDIIILRKGNDTLMNFSYNASVDKGYSLALINGTWIQAIPSPGEPNHISTDTSFTDEPVPDAEIFFSVSEVYLFASYDSMITLHNPVYPKSTAEINLSFYYNLSFLSENTTLLLDEGSANVSFKHTRQIGPDFHFNITGEYLLCAELFSLNRSEFIDTNLSNNRNCMNFTVHDPREMPCNVSISLVLQKPVFEKNESIEFDNTLTGEAFPFEIEYWAEDLFSNLEKEKVKTANLGKKHFSPDFAESDKVFIIKSNLTMIFCNNTNNNTFAQALAIVKGSRAEINNMSNITIGIVPEESEFGEILNVGITIYKGDTRKSLVEAYIKGDEKISSVTGIKIIDKFTETELDLPLQLKDNCDKRYPEGRYSIVVEGLDAYAVKEINVKQNRNCPETKSIKASGSASGSTGGSSPVITQPKDKNYELLSVVQDIFSSEVIATVRIINKENKTHSYSIWSYLYKGITSYSGEREGNKMMLNLGPGSEETVVLGCRILPSHPDELMLKIKILREDRKTPYEITQDILIEEDSLENTTKNMSGPANEKAVQEKDIDLPGPDFYSEQGTTVADPVTTSSEGPREIAEAGSRITGEVIFESKTERLKGYFILFIISVVIIAIVAFVKLRPKKENVY